jgi:hypothetical protein
MKILWYIVLLFFITSGVGTFYYIYQGQGSRIFVSLILDFFFLVYLVQNSRDSK